MEDLENTSKIFKSINAISNAIPSAKKAANPKKFQLGAASFDN